MQIEYFAGSSCSLIRSRSVYVFLELALEWRLRSIRSQGTESFRLAARQ